MSFFKDFKDDLSLAVNELLPGEDLDNEDDLDEESEMMVNTLEGELDIESELSKLDGLLEQVHDADETENVPMEPELGELPGVEDVEDKPAEKPKREVPKKIETPSGNTKESHVEKDAVSFDAKPEESGLDFESADEPVIRSIHPNHKSTNTSITFKEEIPMNEEMTKDVPVMEGEMPSAPEITDEVSIITDGTVIKGNLSTTGSFSISGRVEGNVQCNGKLEVTGTIKGNSSSSEIFSDAAKIEGEIVSTGTVKIGLGSVVVGNITATSAVIAGAVKGDIDVQGPVVVDTSAVIVGNIKSRSVQINNGAVIEGFCSQCYAEIDVESLFGDTKKGKQQQ